MPTTCIAGVHDLSTPMEVMADLAARLPVARLVEMDAPHMAFLERPREFAAAVRDTWCGPGSRHVRREHGVIDLHRHLWSIFERYAAVREIAARGLVGGVHQHSEAPVQDVGSRAAEIRAEMDTTGVDRSCLLLGDYGLRLGEGDLSIEAENRLATDLAREDPEHFIAFFGIDPRRPGAVELFRDALDAGARGLKLHPCPGYSPSDPVCRPLYALAGERLHTWVETFRRLPEIAERHGVEVTPDEVDQMLGTTAASLMGLA